MDFVINFADNLKIDGLTHHLTSEQGKAPMLIFVYDGKAPGNVMLYGHLDKQPHMDGWRPGTGPTTPAVIDGRLYGRGSSDDGYVPFAVLLAIRNAIAQGANLPRLVLVLETEEESGSENLVHLLNQNKDVIGNIDSCICLDSGCLTYDSLWLTSTLRGMCIFHL